MRVVCGMVGSVGLDDFVEFLDVEVEHFVGDALDVVVFEFEFDPQEADLLLGEVDQLLQFHFDLVAFEVVADEDAVVEAVHHVLLEVLLQRRLRAADQRQLLYDVDELADGVLPDLVQHVAVHLHQLRLTQLLLPLPHHRRVVRTVPEGPRRPREVVVGVDLLVHRRDLLPEHRLLVLELVHQDGQPVDSESEQFAGVGPGSLVLGEAEADDVLQFWGVVGGEFDGVLVADDVLGDEEGVVAGEGGLEGHDLVGDAAETPDVGLLVVGLVLDDLGAGVSEGAEEGVVHVQRLGNSLGQSEVGHLEVALPIDHDVRGVEVPVHDLFVAVQVPQHRQQRDQKPPDGLLLEVGALLVLVLDEFGEVAALDDLHHDVEEVVLGEGLVELDDVGVLQLFVDLHLPEVLVQLLVFLLALPPQFLQTQPFEGVLVVALPGQEDVPEGALPQFLQQVVVAHYLQPEVLVLHYLTNLLKLVLDFLDLRTLQSVEHPQGLQVGLGGLDEVPDVEEGAQQFRREDALEYLAVLLEGADVAEEAEEEHSELVEGLRLVLLVDVLELDHVAVEGVGANEEEDGFLESFLDVLGAHVVVEHEVGEDLDVEDHFLVVEQFLEAQADEGSEVVEFEVVDDLGLGGQQQLVDAAQQGHLEHEVALVALQLVYQGRRPVDPQEVLVELPVLEQVLDDTDEFGLVGRLEAFEGEDESADVPHLLEHLVDPLRNQLPGYLQYHLGRLGVVHHQQVHYLAEHLVTYQLRVHLNEPQVQRQDLDQHCRRVSHLRHRLVYPHQELLPQQSPVLP